MLYTQNRHKDKSDEVDGKKKSENMMAVTAVYAYTNIYNNNTIHTHKPTLLHDDIISLHSMLKAAYAADTADTADTEENNLPQVHP